LSGVREPDATNEAAAQDAPEPYVAPQTTMAELTVKAVALGIAFGVIFGAATVYLALKAGLTVSASIPIAVLAISVFKKLGSSTILENNIVQTIGSAGESIAAGVVFTLPGFLFLGSGGAGVPGIGAPYFSYWTILTLAMVGGVLGVLMMIPLRRSLIVQEHANLPYPEGTACASVLIAGEKGGNLARTAYLGLGVAFKMVRKLHVGGVHINETSSSRVDLMPYGGTKDSGFGREGPRYSIHEMSEQRTVTFTS